MGRCLIGIHQRVNGNSLGAMDGDPWATPSCCFRGVACRLLLGGSDEQDLGRKTRGGISPSDPGVPGRVDDFVVHLTVSFRVFSKVVASFLSPIYPIYDPKTPKDAEFHIFLCIRIINWIDGRQKDKRQLSKIHENSRKNTNHHKHNLLCGQQLVDSAARRRRPGGSGGAAAAPENIIIHG